MTLPFSTFIYGPNVRCMIWYLTIEEHGMYPVRFPDPLVRKWVGKPDYELLTGVPTSQVTWLKGEECFWITLNQRTCPTTNILVCVGFTPRWRRSTYSWQPQRGCLTQSLTTSVGCVSTVQWCINSTTVVWCHHTVVYNCTPVQWCINYSGVVWLVYT